MSSTNTPTKCVNCSGAHLANSVQCPHYEKALKKRTTRFPPTTTVRNETTYKEASIPQYNIWDKKKEEAIQKITNDRKTKHSKSGTSWKQNNSDIFTQIKKQIEILNSQSERFSVEFDWSQFSVE